MNKKEWLKNQNNRKILLQYASKPKVELLKGIGLGYDVNEIAYNMNTIWEIHILMILFIKIGWCKMKTYSDYVVSDASEKFQPDEDTNPDEGFFDGEITQGIVYE